MMAAVHQWEHLISLVSVQLATLDLPVRLTLMTVCLQPAQATACVWMQSTPLCALAYLDLRTPVIIVVRKSHGQNQVSKVHMM